MEYPIDYKKFKWFFTSSGKLVVGGKNAEQNDLLLNEMKKISMKRNEDYVVMHTESPGSPFSIILAPKNNIKDTDLEECAIFTASFSQAWKSKKKKVMVHKFLLSSLNKDITMKTGTWSVQGKIEKIPAALELVLTKQDGILRAVPESSVKKKSDILFHILPGKINKNNLLQKIAILIECKYEQSEILSALPAGGIKIIQNKK